MKKCKVDRCENNASRHKTICAKHRHRWRTHQTYDKTPRKPKENNFPPGIVKICKLHGELNINQVSAQYSKYKDKKYSYYSCKECISLKKKRLYDSNPKKNIDYSNATRLKHYNKVIKRDREYKLKQLLSVVDFESILKKQNNVCAICKLPETHRVQKSRIGILNDPKELKRLAVDHCHATNKVRGLLCAKCNTALGSFKDSIANLESAIEYLKSFII